MIDYRQIAEKWQKAWKEARLYEPEPDERKGMLVTAALPYVNMPPHLGHLRTYGTADFYARYLRMRGLNVLYPMAWHFTGTPILAIAKRIAANDEELKEELRLYHIDNETMAKMSDPNFITEYYSTLMKDAMVKAGYSIDWRRTFNTLDPLFSKMVEWQFGKLHEKGLLVQGAHPVGWCTNENNAVGQHDTKHDVQPEIEQMYCIKFKDSASAASFLCATYRPETIYGVTNIFVNGSSEYVVADIGGESVYLSGDAAQQLSNQLDIKVKGKVNSAELLSKKAVNPVSGEEIPVLEGYFVKSDFGTGIVMSVPAHAPFDYAALERLRMKGISVPSQYKKCISLPGEKDKGNANSEIPALAYLEVVDSWDSVTDAVLEKATKALYREELKNGIMDTGKYAGKKVSESREAIAKDLEAENKLLVMYTIANEEPVYCRCGTRVTVKIVKDQWFINYGDEKWKAKVVEYFPKVKVYDERYAPALRAGIDWINLRPAERAQGLGTKFPLNPSHIIESLSDSTIYMAFYTFSHILRSGGIKPEQMKPEFFDYVFNGERSADEVSKVSGIPKDVVSKCKASFDYWYANTSRHSGPDLLLNHLIMYLFNHIAMFQSDKWPKQIVVNGFVNYEGEKMSKSLGNIIPLLDGIEKFGADIARFIEIVGSDLYSNSEFNPESAESIRLKNEYLAGLVEGIKSMGEFELTQIDFWLYSKLNSKIKKVSERMEVLDLRGAYIEVYYNSINELKWYFERGGSNAMAVREFLEKVILMLAPAMPHFAEEMWHNMGNKDFAVQQKWPICDQGMISEESEFIESMAAELSDDINRAVELSSKMDANKGKKPKSVHIIVAGQWKFSVLAEFLKSKDITKALSSEAAKGLDKEKAAKFLSQFSKKGQPPAAMPATETKKLAEALESAKEFLQGRTGIEEISIEQEENSKSSRADRATPLKPSIDILWD